MTNQENQVKLYQPEEYAPKSGVIVETTENGRRTSFYFRNSKGEAFRVTLFHKPDSVFPPVFRVYRYSKIVRTKDTGWTSFPTKFWQDTGLTSFKTLNSTDEVLAWLDKPMFRNAEGETFEAVSKALQGVYPQPGTRWNYARSSSGWLMSWTD